jgi:2,3-dihydroxybenzoate decarboxylase
MKRIAVEEHISVKAFESLAAEQSARLKFPNLSDPDRMANTLGPVMFLEPSVHRIPEMDKYGIDIQVLSVGGGAVQNDLDAARAVANARYANDVVYETIRQYPDRFYGFGLLAMQDPAAAVQELERCVKELGFVGIMLHGATNFSYYDEPQYYPIWAKLEELGVPLYLHVGNPEADQIRMYDGYPEILGNTWNWGVVGATHALRIMFGGVFDRYPGAQLILGHMGESLPYLLGRLDEGYDCRGVKKMGRMAHHPSYYMKNNIYITTSGGFQPEAMICAIMGIGVERILFANDYPHYSLTQTMAQMEACPLTDEQFELIYHGNAERLLKLK